MSVQHHPNLKSTKRRTVFIFSPCELVLWILFVGGQRNSFWEEIQIFVKGNHLLSCAAFARKRLCSFCSTSAQPRPSCAFFSRMSVCPSVHAPCRHSPARCAHLCRLDLLPEERGGTEGWGGSTHIHTHSQTLSHRAKEVERKEWWGTQPNDRKREKEQRR